MAAKGGAKPAAKGAAKGGAVKRKPTSKKYKQFKVEGGQLKKIGKTCPKCGVGVYMAQHKDRLTCGKCGYTEKIKN